MRFIATKNIYLSLMFITISYGEFISTQMFISGFKFILSCKLIGLFQLLSVLQIFQHFLASLITHRYYPFLPPTLNAFPL